jgi:Ca2+-binding EF-hand superfamily protein
MLCKLHFGYLHYADSRKVWKCPDELAIHFSTMSGGGPARSGTLRAKGAPAMKTNQPRKTAVLRTLVAASALACATAEAGLDANADFIAADLDVSGSLSVDEFTTTLDADLSVRAVNRAFRSADANRDLSIQLNEYLLFTGTYTPENRLDRQFYLADVSIDGSLDFEEYVDSRPGRAPLIVLRRQFLQADADDDDAISLEEWIAFRTGQTPANGGLSVFELADVDADGEVDPAEFASVYPRGFAEVRLMAKFNKLDDNEDGVLTTDEWNPGRRGAL